MKLTLSDTLAGLGFKYTAPREPKPKEYYKNAIPVKNPKIGANIQAMHEKWLNQYPHKRVAA